MGLEAGEGGPAEAGVLQTLDVPLDMGVSPHGGIRFDGRSFRIGVEAPVAESRPGKRLRWAPGWRGSRRTTRCVPCGRLGSLINEVSSQTEAPSRGSPSWVMAGSQAGSHIHALDGPQPYLGSSPSAHRSRASADDP